MLDEGLRREGYFCGGRDFDGREAPFWNASDAARASAPPHRWGGVGDGVNLPRTFHEPSTNLPRTFCASWVEWTTARDQKLYSDVVAGSCCGAPQHKLMFPGTYKVLDQYAFT